MNGAVAWQRVASMVVAAAVLSVVSYATPISQPSFGPGARVLLDAHNAYPERGRYADRIERALSTGTPIAVEQDLYWYRPANATAPVPVVAHDDDALTNAPTLDAYFFQRIRPIMESALASNDRSRWPLIVLNLDFKDNTPAHIEAVWALLRRYETWLTTAPRTSDANSLAPFTVGPLLVLTGSDTTQRRIFHDAVPIGNRLLAFGAVAPVPVSGATRGQRQRRAVQMTAAEHIPATATNYARWVNFPWSVVEQGGQNNAREWSTADAARLRQFVDRAHAQQLWIRFYTLDGFAKRDNAGYSDSYNFGSLTAVRPRWSAALSAGVDFVATDQYEQFAAHR
jgi:hypothetical protein